MMDYEIPFDLQWKVIMWLGKANTVFQEPTVIGLIGKCGRKMISLDPPRYRKTQDAT
jgi:hypothetical protein